MVVAGLLVGRNPFRTKQQSDLICQISLFPTSASYGRLLLPDVDATDFATTQLHISLLKDGIILWRICTLARGVSDFLP